MLIIYVYVVYACIDICSIYTYVIYTYIHPCGGAQGAWKSLAAHARAAFIIPYISDRSDGRARVLALVLWFLCDLLLVSERLRFVSVVCWKTLRQPGVKPGFTRSDVCMYGMYRVCYMLFGLCAVGHVLDSNGTPRTMRKRDERCEM